MGCGYKRGAQTVMYALVDCNNFFVSCERVFAPYLNGKPTIVLSNNDGCAIARSEEAKALGIPMGAPLFKFRDIVEAHDVKVFSSNFSLYGDISRRVVDVLHRFAPEVEVYSVDESFVYFPFDITPTDALEWGRKIRDVIWRWVGVPTRVGFGPTKTLAKLANNMAKERSDGVCYVGADYTDLFKKTPIENVWGIGRNNTKKLYSLGVYTVYDFTSKTNAFIRKNFTVVGLKTAFELRGVPCFTLEDAPEPRKNRLISRSFGEEVTQLADLKEALVQFCHAGGRKLRKAGQFASALGVFVRTNPHKNRKNVTSGSAVLNFEAPTNNTLQLIKGVEALVKKVYVPGHAYKKAGIMLFELVQAHTPRQQSMVPEEGGYDHIGEAPALMEALDAIQKKCGRFSIGFGRYGLKARPSQSKWQGRREKTSPLYTTSWEQLPDVK